VLPEVGSATVVADAVGLCKLHIDVTRTSLVGRRELPIVASK
jgi:hypothetical protein